MIFDALAFATVSKLGRTMTILHHQTATNAISSQWSGVQGGY
jgi:hypothetical protein